MPNFGGSTTRDPSGLTARTPGLTVDTQRSRRNNNDVFFTTFVNRTPGGLADLSARRIQALAGDVREQQGQFVPGFGIVSQRSRDRGRQAVGNLRDSLARRRVRGSSFAQQLEAQQQRENEALEQEAILQEIRFQQALRQEEAALLAQGVNQTLAEAGIATGQGQALAQLFTQADALQSQLEAEGSLASAAGQILGTAAGFAVPFAFGAPGAAPTTPTGGSSGSVQISRAPRGINNPIFFGEGG